uniref:Uncharacterized protein n=1 Tax=Arundo donax TaxID=35708 RepID=A0A0A9CZK7_ARUDO
MQLDEHAVCASKTKGADNTSISRCIPEHILRTWKAQAPKACPFAITVRCKNIMSGSIVMSSSSIDSHLCPPDSPV